MEIFNCGLRSAVFHEYDAPALEDMNCRWIAQSASEQCPQTHGRKDTRAEARAAPIQLISDGED